MEHARISPQLDGLQTMVKIYTKTGDEGETGLLGGTRVSKDDARIEAYGTVDELNAELGVVRACGVPTDVDVLLASIQGTLFSIGAELAAPAPDRPGIVRVADPQVRALESTIDQLESDLPPLRQFILPGGSATAAAVHRARAVCRRAERRIVTLGRSAPEMSEVILRYVNRLSDLLFVLARWTNAQAEIPDVPWKSQD